MMFSRAFLLAVIAVSAISAEPLTKLERERLVAHLQMTDSWLADEVSHLSSAQLNYRYAPGKWTILDVVEHLVTAEPLYWAGFQKSMHAEPSKPKKASPDADMLWYGIDRTERQKTGKDEEPVGKLKDVAAGLASYHKMRATLIDYVKTTNDDLRGHVFTDWGVEGFQGMLGISSHAQRHIMQIREIKAQPGYPSK